MKTWKIFIMCHNVIWDEMYRHDPDFGADHFAFLKLGRHDLLHNPAAGYRILDEFEFPIHLDEPHYAEFTGIYCVYRNRLHEGLDYIGFSHYDKEHRMIGSGGTIDAETIESSRRKFEVKRKKCNGPTQVTRMIDQVIDSPAAVHVSLESHEFWKIYNQRILMDESRPNAFVGDGINCIDRILYDYNTFFDTRYTIRDMAADRFLTMCDCFVTPVPVFEKLMSFIAPIIEERKLDIFDTERRHRLQGGLLERYVAVFFALEKIRKVDMTIIHQYWNKRS